MTEYAWVRERPGDGGTYYYRSDTAVAHSCTDEAHESPHTGSTTIMFYETDETETEEDQA